MITNYLRIAAWSIPPVLLLIPLIAMRFTDEVVWTLSDFVFMAGLLFGTGIALELAMRTGHSAAYRAGAVVAIGTSFFLVWINAAAGFIGGENNDANMMYPYAVAIGIFGAVAVKFRPMGMAYVLVCAALMQVAIPIIALIASMVTVDTKACVLTAGFTALWLCAAGLFRKSAAKPK